MVGQLVRLLNRGSRDVMPRISRNRPVGSGQNIEFNLSKNARGVRVTTALCASDLVCLFTNGFFVHTVFSLPLQH